MGFVLCVINNDAPNVSYRTLSTAKRVYEGGLRADKQGSSNKSWIRGEGEAEQETWNTEAKNNKARTGRALLITMLLRDYLPLQAAISARSSSVMCVMLPKGM